MKDMTRMIIQQSETQTQKMKRVVPLEMRLELWKYEKMFKDVKM